MPTNTSATADILTIKQSRRFSRLFVGASISSIAFASLFATPAAAQIVIVDDTPVENPGGQTVTSAAGVTQTVNSGDNIELEDMSVADASPSNLRVIKSHLEAEFIPYSAEAKYISVIRDPKDLLVSMVMFENGFNELLCGGSVPIDAFVKSFQSDRFQYQSWPVFINSWWELKERENVLLVTFEEMKANPARMIRTVAAFLGVSLTGTQTQKVFEKTSFNYMKANDCKFAQPAGKMGNVPLVRSGKDGNSKELLNDDQQQQIDDFCMQTLERIGSDFPYREKFTFYSEKTDQPTL